MRKTILAIILCFSITSLCSIPTHAALENFGSLSYWYSTSDYIGRWYANSVNVYVEKLHGENAAFYFTSGMLQACSLWESVTGLTLNVIPGSAGSPYSAPIEYYGGYPDEVMAIFGDDIDIGSNGFTNITGEETDGTWIHNLTMKFNKKISQTEGAIFDRGTERTTNEYLCTCIHELGHALGWFGHSDNSSDIMYRKGTANTSLTYRDKRHLSQIYD